MARDTNDAVERLNEIWNDWSLGHGLDVMKAQREALAILVSRLDQERPEMMLRAVQALLADPERPGVGKRPLFRDLWKSVNEHWLGAGSRSDDVQQLQAMLLAAWPRERRSDGFGLLPMLMSPWEIMGGREVQKPQLERWWEESVRMEADERDSQSLPAPQRKKAVQNRQGGADSLRVAGKAVESLIPTLTQHSKQNAYSPAGPLLVQLAQHFSNIAGKAIPDILDQVAFQEDVSGLLDQRLSDVQQLWALERSRLHDRSELLWWGQARYCHTLRKPFRRIDDADTCLWWAAWEASVRAQDLPIEPSASYLQEVLHSLGHRLDESRPLGEWMARLHQCITAHSPEIEPVCEHLAALAREDALALPVTWVRLQTGNEMNLAQAADAIALPLDASIDRGQWAAWIFREVLLDHFFTEAE